MKMVSARPWTAASIWSSSIALVPYSIAAAALLGGGLDSGVGGAVVAGSSFFACVSAPLALLGLLFAVVALFKREGLRALVGLILSAAALGLFCWLALLAYFVVAMANTFL
jgi:hypothetical protein